MPCSNHHFPCIAFASPKVFGSTAVAADITLALIQKRDWEHGLVNQMNVTELRERAMVFDVQVKRRRKLDYQQELVFQQCQVLSIYHILEFAPTPKCMLVVDLFVLIFLITEESCLTWFLH